MSRLTQFKTQHDTLELEMIDKVCLSDALPTRGAVLRSRRQNLRRYAKSKSQCIRVNWYCDMANACIELS